MKTITILLMMLILIIITGCSLISNSIEDIQKNPSQYLNKSVTVIGTYEYDCRQPLCSYIIKDKNGYYLPFNYTGINTIPGSQVYTKIQIKGVLKQRTYNIPGIPPKEVTDYYIEANDIRSVNYG
jgi:hypothetical protein